MNLARDALVSACGETRTWACARLVRWCMCCLPAARFRVQCAVRAAHTQLLHVPPRVGRLPAAAAAGCTSGQGLP